MLYFTLEPADLYGFSSLDDYQFVGQVILYLLLLAYDYHYIQYLMDIVVNFITNVLSRFGDTLFAVNHLLIWERTIFIGCRNHIHFC
jgi:hypothetical protein